MSKITGCAESQKRAPAFAVIAASLALFAAAPAFAGQKEADEAILRAQAKIDTATRQAGQAADTGDQSFNMARERVESARAAQKDAKYDRAEMLAEEAAVLADLTAERAVLAALQSSQAALNKAVVVNSVVQ